MRCASSVESSARLRLDLDERLDAVHERALDLRANAHLEVEQDGRAQRRRDHAREVTYRDRLVRGRGHRPPARLGPTPPPRRAATARTIYCGSPPAPTNTASTPNGTS